MKKFIGTMTALAVALSASAAMAGVYVSGPLPSEFAGGHVTPNPDVFKAVGKRQKEGAKLAGGVSKCFSKGAKNVSKGNPSGVDTCINNSKKGVVPKYIAKASSTTPAPPCANDSSTTAAIILSLTKGFNGTIYCQSPSGAFLDEAGF